MFKIKSLILLLSSITFLSCSSNQPSGQYKYSVGYIGGEYDGLILSNQLTSHLKNFNMLDERSIYEIQSVISHSQNVYVTNIDNTSDREKVESSINFRVYNKNSKCYVHSYDDKVSQFYILASSASFNSNKRAIDKIKFENTDYFVKNFINSVIDEKLICDENK
tara:strand:- start:2253 stop:2744 length:492 start_codon:yes stop_codon:yes gene_type:complete